MLFSEQDGIFTCLHLLWLFPKLKQLQGIESERWWAFLTPIHQPACFSCNVAFTTVWLFMGFFWHLTSLHFTMFNNFHFIMEFHIFFPHKIFFSFFLFLLWLPASNDLPVFCMDEKVGGVAGLPFFWNCSLWCSSLYAWSLSLCWKYCLFLLLLFAMQIHWAFFKIYVHL